VRAPQSDWQKGSVIAVDAGAHLASIIRILERHMPLRSDQMPPADYSRVLDDGPFAGIRFPHLSAKANALYFFRELLHSFLITHPHLDHLSGMAINTPALEYGREAKAIVALPSTIDSIKDNIFNDWTWPNLSDEGNGVGFVTYRRLIEGGNPRLGSGEGRGYVNVCEGLATKCWSVSHGKCRRRSPSFSHQHTGSFGWDGGEYNFASRRLSRISDDHGYFAAMAQQQAQNAGGYTPILGAQFSMAGGPGTPGLPATSTAATNALENNHLFEPVSSSAFFIRNDETGHELLIFGDIEPDSVSMSPRNYIVWEDAAQKIANGTLKAIFIECSYDDSVRNEDLYGHLCPRHLIAELSFLALCVIRVRQNPATEEDQGGEMRGRASDTASLTMNMRQPPTPAEVKRKRKRAPNGDLATTPELTPTTFATPPSPQPLPSPYVGHRAGSTSRRKTSHGPGPESSHDGRPSTPSKSRQVQFQAPGQGQSSAILSSGAPAAPYFPIDSTHTQTYSFTPREKFAEPLRGVTVHIIHVKDTMTDGPAPEDIIVGQLRTLAEESGLGVEFNVTSFGQTIWV